MNAIRRAARSLAASLKARPFRSLALLFAACLCGSLVIAQRAEALTYIYEWWDLEAMRGGLLVGTKAKLSNTADKVSGIYGPYSLAFNAKSLATTCTDDGFTEATVTGKAASITTLTRGSLVTLTLGSNSTKAFSMQARVGTNDAILVIKTCTFGTVDADDQNLRVGWRN